MRVSTRAKWAVGAGLEEIGLAKYHYAVLAALDDDAPASQADLSRRTGIDRSDIVAVVNELEARQAIERMTDPDDRRRNLITMTTVGVDLLDELQRIIDAAQDELLVHLDAEERKQLVRLLQRVLGEPTTPSE
jgi:DNA-binding MarR family transcriptional regulator